MLRYSPRREGFVLVTALGTQASMDGGVVQAPVMGMAAGARALLVHLSAAQDRTGQVRSMSSVPVARHCHVRHDVTSRELNILNTSTWGPLLTPTIAPAFNILEFLNKRNPGQGDSSPA